MKENKGSFGAAKKIAWLMCLMLAGCAGSQQSMVQQAETPEKTEVQNRARVHTDLAASYYGRAQHGVALEELNVALRADPGFTPAYNMLGLVYMELREDKQAEQAFLEALRFSPNDSEAHNNYGWFLCTHGRAEQSISHFLAAIKNPLYATPDRAYLNAGICARKQGDDAAAERYLLNALKIRPLQQQALYQIAELYFAQGRYEEANHNLGRHLQVTAPSADSLWLAVRLDRKLGDRNAEASHSLQLRRQFPESPQVKLLKSGRYE